ncbi:MAG TPA: hypothetical protein VF229_03085 [Burkholderiaceae bacterium]
MIRVHFEAPAPMTAGKIAAATAIALACAAAAVPAMAEDRADIDKTEIIGNRELPKVLYIVPWKQPQPGELSGRPAQSLLDEVLGPVDRDEFRRQVRYHALVQGAAGPAQAEAGKSGSGQAGGAAATPPARP